MRVEQIDLGVGNRKTYWHSALRLLSFTDPESGFNSTFRWSVEVTEKAVRIYGQSVHL